MSMRTRLGAAATSAAHTFRREADQAVEIGLLRRRLCGPGEPAFDSRAVRLRERPMLRFPVQLQRCPPLPQLSPQLVLDLDRHLSPIIRHNLERLPILQIWF